MTNRADQFNQARCDAWTVYNLIAVLHAALPDDSLDALPVRCMLSHIMDLAKDIPDAIEQLEREVDRG
ncbi:hypothetical protein [Paraburkholderia bannensis]|uniref:hypothetical protein n=1 Tax=Paraburkholderia bannensis TaxID=765414 RepID=UPI0005A8450D|nr:hypothetical protein [Paraburkholderia bannensis]